MGDEKSDAWKERCERYFSSFSEPDNGKYCENSEKSQKKWKSFKEFSSTMSTRSTSNFMKAKACLLAIDVHGARLAGTTRHPLESVIWIIIPFVSLCAFIFFFYLSLTIYLQHSSTFKLETVENNVITPLVTVCNLNKLKKSVVHSTTNRFIDLVTLNPSLTNTVNVPVLQSKEVLETSTIGILLQDQLNSSELTNFYTHLDRSFLPFSVMYSSNDWTSAYKSSLRYGSFVMDKAVSPSKQELLKFGHKSDALLYCWRNGYFCNNGRIIGIQHQKYGNCFTILPDNNQKSGHLELKLDIEPWEYIDAISPVHGARIFVHSGQHSFEDGVGHIVLPGSHSSIILKKIEHYQLTRYCKDDNNYNREACINDCLDDFANYHCKCRYTYEANEAERCRVNVQFEYVCLSSLLFLLSNNKLPCSCPQKCRVVEYISTMSSYPWPTEQNMKSEIVRLEKNGYIKNSTDIRSSVVKLTIDSTSTRSEWYKENCDFSLLQLLCNIGGISALLVGVSVTSVVEVVWVAIRSCIYCCIGAYQKEKKKGCVEKLSDSEFTSVTWKAYKQKRRMEVQLQEETGRTRKSSIPHDSERRNSGRRSSLRTIVEETKSPNVNQHSRDHVTNTYKYPHSNIYTKNNFNRNPSQIRTFNSLTEENRVDGNEFPMFHTLDERPVQYPRCSTPDTDNKSASKFLQMNMDAKHYPERGRIFSPADAIQMYGASAKKYYVSEPMFF